MELNRLRPVGVWLVIAAFTTVAALAEVTGPAELGYKLTVLGQDAFGTTILQSGSIFSIKQPGVLGVLPGSAMLCPATYQNGALHKAGGMCAAMVKDRSAYLQPGLMVYVTKIDVNVKKSRISFRVVACDTCNKTDPPSYYKSEVAFQFDKGYLETATPEAVKQTIGEVLVINTGASSPQAATAPQPPPQPQAPPVPPPAPPPIAEPALAPVPPPPPPPAEPKTISLGQTTDEVTANFGKPEKIVKLPTKQIYYYKDMKVTFVNGKVSDVQ